MDIKFLESVAKETQIDVKDVQNILTEIAAMIKNRLNAAGLPLTMDNIGMLIEPCFIAREKMIQELIDDPIKMKKFQEDMLDTLIEKNIK